MELSPGLKSSISSSRQPSVVMARGCWLVLLLLSALLVAKSRAQAGSGSCSIGQNLEVSISATPDLDPAQPGSQVRIGTRVQISGDSKVVKFATDCSETVNLAPLSWSLSFQPLGGPENDASSELSTPSVQTLETSSTTSFTAALEGIYRATVRGGDSSAGFRTAEVLITAVPLPAVLTSLCGRVTFLRVNEVGSRFGPDNDSIDVEVVTKLSSAPTDAMGFQLRNDDNRPARDGMLDLLRDGFASNGSVCLDYSIVPGKHNGIVKRVTLTRPSTPPNPVTRN